MFAAFSVATRRSRCAVEDTRCRRTCGIVSEPWWMRRPVRCSAEIEARPEIVILWLVDVLVEYLP